MSDDIKPVAWMFDHESGTISYGLGPPTDPEDIGLYAEGDVKRLIAERDAALKSAAYSEEQAACIGTIRSIVGCETRNVSDIDMEAHTREVGAAFHAAIIAAKREEREQCIWILRTTNSVQQALNTIRALENRDE